MAPSLPKTYSPTTPDVFGGEIYKNIGRYARGAVLYAFERIGGAEELAHWAQDNQGEFYTKLFTKVITREVEVQDRRGVDELLDLLDADYEVVETEPEQAAAPSAPPFDLPDNWAAPYVDSAWDDEVEFSDD